MSIFYRVGKLYLIVLVALITYSLFFDFGKSYVAYSKNYYMVRSASNYVTKFSVDPEKLQDFQQKSLQMKVASDSVKEFYEKQLLNQGFVLKTSRIVGGNKLYMEFYPKGNQTKSGHAFEGPIFVRAIFYGFPDTPPSPYGDQKGFVMMNVEQKIPMMLRNLYNSNNVEFNYEDGSNGKDFEGFSGYYSIEAKHAFSLNVVK